MRCPIDVILVCIRWYAAYPLSHRPLEEMMEERGVFVDHSSINRGAIRFLPLLEKVFRKYRDPVGGSWCIDETYIKVKGGWKYLYRAVNKEGKTVDFLLTAKRGQARGRLQPSPRLAVSRNSRGSSTGCASNANWNKR